MRHLFAAFATPCLIGLLACSALGCGSSAAATTPPADDTGAADDSSPAETGDDAAIDTAPPLDNGTPSTTYPAPHGPPPQVESGGGAVLKAPRVVPVYFANDDAALVTQDKDFVNKVGATSYWAATTTEYGVGPLTATPSVDLAETAPTSIDDAAIQTWLAAKLNANDPAFPAPDANTVYSLHYPAGTTITEASGGQPATSCVDFGGYHNNIQLDAAHGSMDVAYVVVPHCANFGGLKGIDSITATESHELIEAATDPFPTSTPAYGQTDEAHLYWLFVLGGGEVGDLCAQNADAFTKFAELPYTVQRTWSNKAALAGHDPCVPKLPGSVYFNAVPVLSDTIALNVGGTARMKGVKIPVGGSKTIDVDLFSDGDTKGTWNVEARDFATLSGGTANLKLTLDRNSGQNGEKLHLTIEVVKASQYKAESFLLLSSQGARQNMWVGLVGN
jgi:hypothetical protein